MYIKIMIKVLLIYWTIVFSVIILKSITDVIPKITSFIFSTVIAEKEKEITMPLEEYFGLIIEDTEGCMKNSKFHTYVKNIKTSSSCLNGECKVTVEFEDYIPKEVGLYIKENGRCIEKKFNVTDNMKTIGYRVDLKLTQEQKNSLGIIEGDRVELKNANAYLHNLVHKYYYYDSRVKDDTIVVNHEEKRTIRFNTKNDSKTQVNNPKTENTAKK